MDDKGKKQIKVLLVEDDPFLMSMYAAKFESERYKVLTADNGLSAVEMAVKEKPDIILLDVLLPKINGFEALKRIRKDKTTTAIPVIILTNLGQMNEVEQGLALGASDYLVKAHFTPTEVMDKIKKVLGL
jgi:DNA-binding response OmpR family regulator